MQSVTGFDHTLLLVEDLDDADRRMRRLGFLPTPRGYHSAHMGTANSTIMLPNMTYFEVIGVVSPTPSNQDMRRMLERRQGLIGYALKTDDAGAFFRECAALSAADGDVQAFSRPVDLPDGQSEARFTVANIAPAMSLGIKMFACCHHTPDLVWRTDYLDQPNGTVGVESLVGEVPDIDGAEAALTALFGERVTRSGPAVTVAYGNVSVSFLSGGALRDRFGIAALGEPALRVLRLRTADLERTAGVLRDNAVAFDTGAERTTVTVAAEESYGTVIQFVAG